jgi:hypothetical protein
VVLSRVQVLPHVVSWQEHVPPEQSGVGWAQAVPLTQEPLALHVCGMLPLQPFELGEQATQLPPRQTGRAPEQALPAVQMPETQVWGTFPMHSIWPGEHIPVQLLPTHVMLTHATGLPHDPAALQVS